MGEPCSRCNGARFISSDSEWPGPSEDPCPSCNSVEGLPSSEPLSASRLARMRANVNVPGGCFTRYEAAQLLDEISRLQAELADVNWQRSSDDCRHWHREVVRLRAGNAPTPDRRIVAATLRYVAKAISEGYGEGSRSVRKTALLIANGLAQLAEDVEDDGARDLLAAISEDLKDPA